MNFIVEQYLCMTSNNQDDLSGYWSLPSGYNSVDSSGDMCYHDWKDYHGFSEDYKFCTKCDAKHYGVRIALYGKKREVSRDE